VDTIELEFRTDDERRREVCRWYWRIGDGNKFAFSLADIGTAFHLAPGKIPAAVAKDCSAFTRSDACDGCGKTRPFLNRHDYQARRARGAGAYWACQECKQAAQEGQENAKKQAAIDRYQAVQEVVNAKIEDDPLDILDMSLRDAIYLLSLIRYAASEDLSHIKPFESLNGQLTPTHELDLEVLTGLHTRGAICVHPGSAAQSLIFENGKYTRFYPEKVFWLLPLAPGKSVATFVAELEQEIQGGVVKWDDDWASQLDELVRTVALHECLLYLRLQLEERDLPFNPGEKTRTVLQDALRRFSIGQVFNLIWAGAAGASDFYVRHMGSRTHAANTVPGAIQRRADRAIAEGWDLKPYTRHRDGPASMVSQVLFVTALALPEGGLLVRAPRSQADQTGAATQ
jgi:hypothetical protein